MSAILGLIVGTIIFFLIDKSFDITYFGCRAIASLWFTCVLLTTAGFMWLGGIILGLLKWILIGTVVLGVIGFVGSKMKGSEE